MELFGKDSKSYLKDLQQRAQNYRIHKSYQLVGLEIAAMLDDAGHKSLYIKLAKKHGTDKLLQIAKSVAERKGIDNKGAYFMKILHSKNI